MHSRQTEHYGLPLYNGTDIINPLTDFNDANTLIDETLYNANERSAQAKETAEQSAIIVTQYDARITEAETIATNAGIKAENTQKMIAEYFDPLKEGGYKVGDIVIYNDKLFSFINPHTGAWDASDVVEQPIGEAMEDVIAQAKTDIAQQLADALAQINEQLERVTNTQSMIAEPFSELKQYEAGDVVSYADKLYVFNSNHEGDWTGTDVTKTNIVEMLVSVSAKIASVQEELDNTKIVIEESEG